MKRFLLWAAVIVFSASVSAGVIYATTPLPGSSTSSSGASTKSGGEGDPMDVRAFLNERGLGRMLVVERNAAYVIAPFGYSKDPGGSPTCAFRMTNVEYAGYGAFADHKIYSNSTIRVTAFHIGGDGSYGDNLTQSPATLNIQDLTPEYLATKTGYDLSTCGDTSIDLYVEGQ